MTGRFRHALCLHPYLRDSRSGNLGLAVFPPTGLEYVAAALAPHVGRLTLLDLRMPGRLRDPAELARFIAARIDLLCISINWEYHFEDVIALVNRLPPDVTTVAGGKQAGDDPELILRRCRGVDAVVVGEGEGAMVEIAAGADWRAVDGLVYRREGQIRRNALRRPVDLAAFPFPDRSLRLRPYTFNVGGFAFRGEEFDVILTARGCPYNCKFCTFSLTPDGRRRPYATRSVASVGEELAAMSAGVVLIGDENFFVQPDRAAAICEHILARGIRKRFIVQSRIEIAARPDVLALAVRAGVKLLLVGVESPSDRILQMLDKGFDTAALIRAFATLRRFPFYLHGYFIYGNPGETPAEMLRIPGFARRLGLDSITYQKLRIEKHSPLKAVVQATPGWHVADDNLVYPVGEGYPFLARISRCIQRRFYTPGRLVRIVQKAFAVRLFTLRDHLPALLAALPVVLANMIGREIEKKLPLRGRDHG